MTEDIKRLVGSAEQFAADLERQAERAETADQASTLTMVAIAARDLARRLAPTLKEMDHGED